MIKNLRCCCPLSAPAISPKYFAKAQDVGADMVIVDLEDGVPAHRKEEARHKALPFLKAQKVGIGRSIRINTLDSEEGLRDLVFLFDHGIQPDLLLLPKIEHAGDIRLIDKITREKMPNTGLAPVIETARALAHSFEIAAASPRNAVLFFGAADFTADLGVKLEWENLLYARSKLMVSAAGTKVPVVDAPLFDIYNLEGLRTEARSALELGFSGKAAIHPSQVEVIRNTFVPSQEKIILARRILEAVQRNDGKICVLDGHMIGPPAVAAAKRLIRLAQIQGVLDHPVVGVS